MNRAERVPEGAERLNPSHAGSHTLAAQGMLYAVHGEALRAGTEGMTRNGLDSTDDVS
jgi:hypothetical protein